MFLGTYEHTIDQKGRMTIPARFREVILDGAFITLGFENNLIVLKAQTFTSLSDTINKMSITNPDARDLRRLMFSHAIEVEIDKAGRILIPSHLRSKVQLEDQAIVLGAGVYFEIWAPTVWTPRSEALLSGEINNKRFEALDLSL